MIRNAISLLLLLLQLVANNAQDVSSLANLREVQGTTRIVSKGSRVATNSKYQRPLRGSTKPRKLTETNAVNNPKKQPKAKVSPGNKDPLYKNKGIKPPLEAGEPLVMEAGDLNIRFNKIPLEEDSIANHIMPLHNGHYPMRGILADELKKNSTAESVMTFDDYELAHVHEQHYMELAGGPPTFPNRDPEHPFWQVDFRAVVEMQMRRRDKVDPAQLMTGWPDLWKNFDIAQIAEAVHDEYPGYHQSQLLMSLFAQNVKIDYDVLPFRSKDDFIGLVFRMAHFNTWSTVKVAPSNFRAKWYFGRPRPEEVVWHVHQGSIAKEHVPEDLYNIISSWQLQDAFEFTAYTSSGCPRHPSWPAMHSAASSSSMWMAVVFDLTPAQYCQALRTDYAVSHARTVAGVHYPSDNIAGLNMGQALVADALPDYLVETYNATRSAVAEKIERYRFDWKDFDPDTCSTAKAEEKEDE